MHRELGLMLWTRRNMVQSLIGLPGAPPGIRGRSGGEQLLGTVSQWNAVRPVGLHPLCGYRPDLRH